MYQITDALNVDGFSIHPAHHLIQRNHASGSYNTLEFFQIQVIFKETEITVENKTYPVPKGSLVFISPGKMSRLAKDITLQVMHISLLFRRLFMNNLLTMAFG